MSEDEQHQTRWADAMADVADELLASLPGLSRGERRLVSLRVAALNRVVAELVSGRTVPRLRPGAAWLTSRAKAV
jgi:hypothetical protein